MSAVALLLGIFGLALLMVVHEAGHHLVARSFGLRVLRFSIGFGPALFRYQPRGSDTIYQVALIPFLAYVHVAGMNPFEEQDPNDRGSYGNASLPVRIATIVAGPLANYLFASVLFFAALLVGGEEITSPAPIVEVLPGGPAATADMRTGDRVVAIDGRPIATFEEMRAVVLASPGKQLAVDVDRGGGRVTLRITPTAGGESGGGRILVQGRSERVPVTVGRALTRSVIAPAIVVERLVVGLVRIILQKERAELAGPVGIVKIAASAAGRGIDQYLEFLGVLSAYLGGFNLLPVPGLDGGRLVFLLTEAVTRRRPDARVETGIHALGLVMLVALMIVVTVFDWRR
ncbi:MAG: site-2 protease family protein [Deltaproteobacteria bacterium]|nr:site-2 protease family protein [Deltaproteobacteria bacterium]